MSKTSRRNKKLAERREERAKIVVDGVFGRVDAPTGNRYPSSAMERERQRLTAQIEKLTVQREHRVQDAMSGELFESKIWTRHDNEMEALAESQLTPEEIDEIIYPAMDRALLSAKRTHATVVEARHAMFRAANKLLAEHFYFYPERKKRLEAYTKRALKGYQKWWRRVGAERKLILARAEKQGQSSANSLQLALEHVSPELAQR